MKKWLGSCVAIVFVACTAQAEEWQILGPRALGMGGAHVAVVNDASATYWNPAAYGFFCKKDVKRYEDRRFGLKVGGGGGYASQNDLGAKIANAADLYPDIQDEIESGRISTDHLDDYMKIVSDLKNIVPGEDALTMSFNAHAAIRVWRIGSGIYAFGNISAKPYPDTINISPESGNTDIIDALNNVTYRNTSLESLSAGQFNDLVGTIQSLPGWNSTQATTLIYALDDALNSAGIRSVSPEMIDTAKTAARAASDVIAGSGGSLDDNQSKIEFDGFGYTEIPLTVGLPMENNVAIGGNVKAMQGRYYKTTISLLDEDNDKVFDDAMDNYVESQTFGVDLGLLFKPGHKFSAGLVGRNLNSPTFDKYGGAGDYKIEPQVRAGIAFAPFCTLNSKWSDMVTVAIDYDITKNKTVVEGYDSQRISGGLEVDLFKFLALRGGVYKNLAEDDVGLVYTAGLGLNLWLLRMDLGAAYGGEESTVEGYDIPEEAKVQLALSSEF